MTPRGAQAAALDWQATKANRAPHWRDGPNGLTCRADRRQAHLVDICQALALDLDQAQAAARAAMREQRHQAARALVLRLCRLDQTGRIVWAVRTPATSPKTPAAARADFNTRWAGAPLPIRDGAVTIQRQRIDHAQALQWLTSAKTPTKTSAKPATLSDVVARLNEQ